MRQMSERLAEIQLERWCRYNYHPWGFVERVFVEWYDAIRDAAVILRTGTVRYSDLAILMVMSKEKSASDSDAIEVAASMAYCVSQGVPMQDQEVTSATV